MLVFEETGNWSTRSTPSEEPLGAELRTNKLNPHMTPSLGIEPGEWEVLLPLHYPCTPQDPQEVQNFGRMCTIKQFVLFPGKETSDAKQVSVWFSNYSVQYFQGAMTSLPREVLSEIYKERTKHPAPVCKYVYKVRHA